MPHPAHCRSIALLAATVALAAVTASAGNGAQVVTTNERLPFMAPVFIPCAGETVSFEGTLHQVTHTTIDATGAVHMHITRHPGGLKGVGQLSGDTYKGTGVNKDVVHADGLPFVGTFVDSFKVIGPGPGNNLLIQATLHMTVDANGVTRSNVVNVKIDCK